MKLVIRTKFCHVTLYGLDLLKYETRQYFNVQRSVLKSFSPSIRINCHIQTRSVMDQFDLALLQN